MKRNFLISVILILAFVSALGGSIFNAAHAFVNSAQSCVVEDTAIDNIEDISLEDVVPLDPFLGSIGFSKFELNLLIVFECFKNGLLALTHIQQILQNSLDFDFIESSTKSEKWLCKGLWLEHNSLRL